jgi:hypothetical protein
MRLLLLASPLLLAGCALNCEEIGCSGAISIYLAGAGADGEWSLEVTKDGETRACTITLPGGEPVCATPLDVAVEAEGMTLTWMTMMGEQGDAVSLRVSHDGVLLLDESFEPDWSEPYYPNGKACDDGMGCSNATVDYSLD